MTGQHNFTKREKQSQKEVKEIAARFHAIYYLA
jgi:hypothetical protein